MTGLGTACARLTIVIIDLAGTCRPACMVYRMDRNFWLAAAVVASTVCGLVELTQMCSVGLV